MCNLILTGHTLTSPHPPSPLPFPNSEFGGEEKGEKREGFEVGGAAAHLKTPISPPLRAAKRQRGGGQGGGAIRSQAPKGPKWLGKIKLHMAQDYFSLRRLRRRNEKFSFYSIWPVP